LQISFDTTDHSRPNDVVGLILLLNSVSPGALQKAMAAIGNPASITYAPPAVSPAALAAIENGYTVSDPAPLPPADEMTEAFGSPLAGADSAPTSVPGAPDATPPQPAAGGEQVDADGLPWDERIHAKTAGGGGTINADGTWRGKRGVAGDLVASVTAEYRAKGYAAPVPPAPAPEVVGGEALPGETPAPPAGDSAPTAPAPTPPPPTSDSAPPAPTDTPAPPASSLAPLARFQALMSKVRPAQDAGKLTVVDITGICQAAGIVQLGELLTKPQHFEIVEAQIDALISAAG
jgi:hypothetical protein